jgi:hypothetical protein
MAKQPTKQDTTPTSDTSPGQRIIMRNQRQVRMDLYKLELTDFRKNVSWQKKQPDFRMIPHVHFWRSHSEQGQVNKHCQAVGGHFHEMKPKMNADGSPALDGEGFHIIECGPALRKTQKVINGKVKTINERVGFAAVDSENGETRMIMDDHHHVVRYDSSEYMSLETKKAIQAANSAAIGPVQTKPATDAQKAQAAAASGAAADLMTESV